MKNIFNKICSALAVSLMISCADNTFEENPLDDNFPFQLVLDADEGGDLADAEDYDVELKFADYLPDLELPNTTINLDYAITDAEEDLVDAVSIDKVVYEVEIDDCIFERELAFTTSADGSRGTITIIPDPDLGSVPEAFEIIFVLPGEDDTKGSFSVEFSNLQSNANLVLGSPNVFEYSVLDNEVAGEWEMELETEDEFELFKELFGPLKPELEGLSFADISGKVTAEFEFVEMKFIVELNEQEELVFCENGDEETEVVNKVIEIETEYDADDGEIEFEGSHEVLNDDGLVEAELDFIIESEFERDMEILSITFFKIVDEDHFKEDDELFFAEDGIVFSFEKD